MCLGPARGLSPGAAVPFNNMGGVGNPNTDLLNAHLTCILGRSGDGVVDAMQVILPGAGKLYTKISVRV